MKPKYFAVQQTGREADIYIFGDIVADRWYEEETSAFSLKEMIKNLDADVINVHIDSCGGAVSEGWAIYNELRLHPARIRTFGAGFVASAALYPFMAGDERYAMEPSAYFFHQALSLAEGNADELRKAADELEKLNQIGLSAFTGNTRLSVEDVLEMERKETWLSPQEALDLGIATAIIQQSSTAAPTQSVKRSIIQQVLLFQAQKPLHGRLPVPEPEKELSPESSLDVLPEPEPVSEPVSVIRLLGKAFSEKKELPE